ncbi:hypothetical protein RYX36_002586 [Vicia faba]
MGEADSVSAYDMVASWLISPSCIFLVVNLVICTIVITSRLAAQRKNQSDSPQQIVPPTSSFFERVTSFGLGCCKFKPPAASVETEIEPIQNQGLGQLDQAIASTKAIDASLCKTEMNQGMDDLIQNPLTRAPSLLERLMSGNFGRLKSVKVEEEKKAGSEMEEEVDAKADDFIKRFKQQLRLERLDSILRYRDILHRRS